MIGKQGPSPSLVEKMVEMAMRMWRIMMVKMIFKKSDDNDNGECVF